MITPPLNRLLPSIIKLPCARGKFLSPHGLSQSNGIFNDVEFLLNYIIIYSDMFSIILLLQFFFLMPVWWRLLLVSIELHTLGLVNHATDQITVIFLLSVYC